jgi:hypothetical protein
MNCRGQFCGGFLRRLFKNADPSLEEGFLFFFILPVGWIVYWHMRAILGHEVAKNGRQHQDDGSWCSKSTLSFLACLATGFSQVSQKYMFTLSKITVILTFVVKFYIIFLQLFSEPFKTNFTFMAYF